MSIFEIENSEQVSYMKAVLNTTLQRWRDARKYKAYVSEIQYKSIIKNIIENIRKVEKEEKEVVNDSERIIIDLDISEEMHSKLIEMASKEGMSVNELVCGILRRKVTEVKESVSE